MSTENEKDLQADEEPENTSNIDPLKVEIKEAKDFGFDPANANRGTQRGTGMLARSLEQFGAGRSGLADKKGRFIAGNQTFQQIADMGIPIKVVHTTGNEWVVVQRDDLDLDDEDMRAQQMAILDNRVGELNLEWDPGVLAAVSEAGVNLEDFWRATELEKLAKELGRETEMQAVNASAEAAYLKAHKTVSKCMELVTGHLQLDITTAIRIQPELLELKAAIDSLIKETPDEEDEERIIEDMLIMPEDG